MKPPVNSALDGRVQMDVNLYLCRGAQAGKQYSSEEDILHTDLLTRLASGDGNEKRNMEKPSYSGMRCLKAVQECLNFTFHEEKRLNDFSIRNREKARVCQDPYQ